MGIGGAGHRALGRVAVKRTAARHLMLLVLAAAPLGGCSSVADLAGAITGTAATAGSANPALGIAIGVGTRAVADYGLRYASRRWHGTEQDALASTIGAMEIGETRPWQVRHSLPFGAGQGEVRVVRAIDTPLAQCKEALFRLGAADAVAATRWYLASACRRGQDWKWASAEPATERWGSLQ